jgi:hypothetical protein
MLTSSRRGIVYPNTTRADTADVPRDIASVVAALDVDVVYGQGTLAARPTSGLVQGTIYEATDQSPKQFYWWNGTSWDPMNAITTSTINQQGTYSARPSAGSVAAGTKYFATDKVVEYISDGVNWLRLGLPAGTTTDWFNDAVIPTGWVAYDGTNLPSSVGIYDELYAHLGNSVAKPDTQGRVTVSRGTHADVDHALDNDGLAVGSRRVRHKHTVAHTLTLPDHTHQEYSEAGAAADGLWRPRRESGTGGDFLTSSNTGNPNSHPAINGGVTVGPQTGSEPTDGSAFITAVKIAKL